MKPLKLLILTNYSNKLLNLFAFFAFILIGALILCNMIRQVVKCALSKHITTIPTFKVHKWIRKRNCCIYLMTNLIKKKNSY